MRVRLSGFVFVAVLLSAHLCPAAERPPQDLRWTGDHWTAWSPPQPPAGAQIHVIQRGDTLWDLAARFYGDPYLWPQLWERNQYILDAHWIYPGDPLVLGLEVAPVDQLSPSRRRARRRRPRASGTRDTEDVMTSERAAGEPIPLGGESDIYCTGYIGELEESFPHRIIGSEYESHRPQPRPGRRATGFRAAYGQVGTAKYNLSTGDIIYLDGGRARAHPRQPVHRRPARAAGHPPGHPPGGGPLLPLPGRVRVLSVQDQTAIAEIVHSCDPILVGAALRPFERRAGPARPPHAPCARSTSRPRRSGSRPRRSSSSPQDNLRLPRRGPRGLHRPGRRAGRHARRRLHDLPPEPRRPAADRHRRARRPCRPQELFGGEDSSSRATPSSSATASIRSEALAANLKGFQPEMSRRTGLGGSGRRSLFRSLWYAESSLGPLSYRGKLPLADQTSQWTPAPDRRRARPPRRDPGAGQARVRAAVHRGIPEVQPGQPLPLRAFSGRPPQHPPQQGLRPGDRDGGLRAARPPLPRRKTIASET